MESSVEMSRSYVRQSAFREHKMGRAGSVETKSGFATIGSMPYSLRQKVPVDTHVGLELV